MKTHSFDTDIAMLYGVTAAVLLQNIAFWIEKNKANGKGFHDGRYWTYMSLTAFTEMFPYLGKKQIRGALSKLLQDGVIVTGNYSKNGSPKTTWYALTDKGHRIVYHLEDEKSLCQNDTRLCQNDTALCQNDTRSCQNGTTKTDIDKDIINIYITDTNIDDDLVNAHTHEGAKAVLEAMGQTREPTTAEKAMYAKWRSEYTMDADVITAACELTIGARTPSFAYLSRIIDTLHESGVIDMVTFERYRKERAEIAHFCEDLMRTIGCRKPTASQSQQIEMWLGQWHIPKDVLKYAADKAKREPQSYDFLCRSVMRLHDADALNLERAAAVLSGTSNTAKPKKAAHGGYLHHNYTADDLAHIGVTLDE